MTTAGDLRTRDSWLVWYGAFGAGIGWGVQFVIGLALTESHCGPLAGPQHTPGNLDTVTVVVAAVGLAVAVGAWVAAFLTWRDTRQHDDPDPPPAGRNHFLAVIGLTITPLFIAMILMTAIGTVALDPCLQS